MRTIVLDTNVLLSRPEVMYDFAPDDVVIPDTVVGEIDRMKTARVDPELKYKGRTLSRMLFDLAEQGDLAAGVDLPEGGRLRVVHLRDEQNLPDGLSPRNADDRIIATALQACAEGCDDVVLVTSDLNMLIKAQAHNINIQRAAVSNEGFARRWIVRPFQRYRVPLSILAVSLAVFAAIVYLVAFSPLTSGRQNVGLAALPSEFVDQLSVEQQQLLTYLYRLESDPDDVESERDLAIAYDTMSQQNPQYLTYAVKHYEKLLEKVPNDTNARTDLASVYFRSGRLDRALQEVKRVLQQDPEHVNANYNLGIFYLNMQPKEYQKAASQLSRTLQLAKDAGRADAAQRATELLNQVKKEAAAAGQPITVEGGTL